MLALALMAPGGLAAAELTGQPRSELLIASPDDDQIYVHGGSDAVFGLDGSDVINVGGSGWAQVYADGTCPAALGFNVSYNLGQSWRGCTSSSTTGGRDVIRAIGTATLRGHGGPRNDTLSGGSGRDFLYGGAGKDTVRSGTTGGPDYLYGGAGNDTVHVDSYAWGLGGPGKDRLIGTVRSAYLHGGAGDDHISGMGFLIGDGGDDRIVGHGAVVRADYSEYSTARGKPGGDDRIDVRNGVYDTVTCGLGNDVVHADPGDKIRSVSLANARRDPRLLVHPGVCETVRRR